MKKVKDLKVLDGKAAQNISILLGGSLKHLSYNDVKRCILRCDDEVLTDNVLQQLINYLPSPDQLHKLEEYRSHYEDLTEAEQFAITVSLSSISSLIITFHFTFPSYVHLYISITACRNQETSPALEVNEL